MKELRTFNNIYKVLIFCLLIICLFQYITSFILVQQGSEFKNTIIGTGQLDSFFYPTNVRITSSGLGPNNNIYRNEQNRIDSESTFIRCSRYGLQPFNGTPRRLFFGSMVADENWEVFQIHATEVFDIYHLIVLVESNTTHMASPRKLRFTENSKLHDKLTSSQLFGTQTNVIVDYWLYDWPELTGMDRESEQRNTIVSRWKQEGMQPEDVAIMSDIDEVFSRDFLRALQTCDFPELRPGQSCHRPKICPSTISFEGTPRCIKKKEWFHPDAISGQCVDGIGDPNGRPIPLRNFEFKYGERHRNYGRYNIQSYPEDVRKSGIYPLFNGPDIRTVPGDRGMPYTWVDPPTPQDTGIYGVAYHLHNWFPDLRLLRHKYSTYAHKVQNISKKSLSQIRDDLDLLVRCVKGIGNDANPYDWIIEYYDDELERKGPRPIFFLNKTYAGSRHRLTQDMLRIDEELYGSSYDPYGMWIENTFLDDKERKDILYERSVNYRVLIDDDRWLKL